MSETLFKQVNYPLATLVNNIAIGTIGLPDIQRPFVWPNTKVRDLFDSMYRGYPVGYLLFWENSLEPGHRAIGSDGRQVAPSLVIVDGQQRLTSLYAVMRGASVVRSNYRSERIRIAFNPIDRTFAVTSAAIERDRSFIPDISTLWGGGAGLFQVAGDFLDGLRSVREVSRAEERSIQDAIGKLNGLENFPFTALQLDAEITEEDVADVFVRINSQGTPLNQAAFILTLMSVFWDEGRAELERFCRESRTPSADGPSPRNHFIEPSPDQLLRVGIGVAFKRARLQYVYSILRGKDLDSGKFSEERRVEQFERLKQAQAKALNLEYWHDFMQCLRMAGYRRGGMIRSKITLLYAYIFYLIGRTEFGIDERALRPVIAQWFFMSSITGRYSGSSESALETDLAMLRDVATGDEFVSRLRRACGIALTNDFWEVTLPNGLATSTRTNRSYAYEAALAILDAPALFSNFEVVEMTDPALSGPVERRHLFPKGHLATLGVSQTRDVNQIANYAFVEWPGSANVSGQAPAEYLPQLRERFSQDRLATMYRFHALPTGWENMDYWAFLERRRELMADVIRKGYDRLTQQTDDTGREDEIEIDVADLIEVGESDAIEFKSTLRKNLHTGKRDKKMEQAVLKTLAGFLNARGGRLVVGVSDDGSPVGIDEDGFDNEDRMHLHLTNIVNRSIGPDAWVKLHASFDDYEDHRVLVVRCEESRSPVYVKEGNDEAFYVRTGPSTTRLSVSQAMDYIGQRFR